MSKEAKPAATEIGAGDKPAKKGGKLLWIIIGVVILGGGGAAAFLLTGHKAAAKPAADAAADASGSAPPAAPHAPPIYYKFDPAFVVNFGSEGNTRYLQITVETMSRDPADHRGDQDQRACDSQRSGVVVLRAAIRCPDYAGWQGSPAPGDSGHHSQDRGRRGRQGELIEGVYFTSFVIQ